MLNVPLFLVKSVSFVDTFLFFHVCKVKTPNPLTSTVLSPPTILKSTYLKNLLLLLNLFLYLLSWVSSIVYVIYFRFESVIRSVLYFRVNNKF